MVRTSGSNYTHIRQIQIWKYINGTLTNIALASNGATAVSKSYDIWNRQPEVTIDNVLRRGRLKVDEDYEEQGYVEGEEIWHASGSTSDEFLLIDTNGTHNINDLACVSIYNRWASSSVAERLEGVSVQLIDSDWNIVYSEEINHGYTSEDYDLSLIHI